MSSIQAQAGKEINVEHSVGIVSHTTSSEGFQAIIKQRFSDFIVREVDKSGEVAKLVSTDGKELEASIFQDSVVNADDSTKNQVESIPVFLSKLKGLGIELTASEAEMQNFLEKCCLRDDSCLREYIAQFECATKQVRTEVHQLVKQLFPHIIETDTVQDHGKSLIRFSARHKSKKSGGSGGGTSVSTYHKHVRSSWPSNSCGDYLKFVLLKENIDTMQAVNSISKMLHIKSGNLSYAGTKDKRAVTAQWCTVFRKRPSEVRGSFLFCYNNTDLPIRKESQLPYYYFPGCTHKLRSSWPHDEDR